MLFNSSGFIFLFFPFVLAISLRLKGQWLLGWISLSSYVFYALFGHLWFLAPMMVTTVLDFYLAPYIYNASTIGRKKLFLMISLCGNLGLLVYFKYAGLLLKTGQSLLSVMGGAHASLPWMAVFSVVLPAGISFYTFQTLSYVIDVYRGDAQPEKNFLKFVSFVSFFPHLVAGPLTRHNQLLPGLERIKEEGITPKWEEGIFLFAVGLSKKTLLADPVGRHVDYILSDMTSMHMASAWLAVLGYSLQIYFDFSGYSDMAIGLGRLFGIELPQNFNSPYQSRNPSDFWRRWHITLSQWLRDYLYIPLGGNRTSTPRQLLNIMITMFLGGLWHGAQWTFALWGLYHGALIVLYHVTRRFWDKLRIFLQRIACFLLVSFGWIFFRSDSMHHLRQWIWTAFDWHSLPMPLSPDLLKMALIIAGELFIINLFGNASSYKGFKRLSAPWQVGLGLLTVTAMLFMNYSSKFLYFQF